MCRIKNPCPQVRLFDGWAWSAAIAVMFSAGSATAAPTVLDFEDFPSGTTITTQYNAQGVLFDRAYLSNAALFSGNTVAHSGTRVIRSDNPINEFHAPPLVITFTSPQVRVRMFAGCEVVPINATLRAFDANNVQVAEDGPRQVAADVFNTEFQVTVTTATIMRVELQYESTAFEAIDDLEFEGEPPPPPVAEPPIVEIVSPADGSELDVETIDIQGIARGEGLLSPVTLKIEWRRPPESTAPPFTSTIPLTGTGTTRQFSLTGFTGVPMGPITITAEVENRGGKKGTGTSTFTNLPAPIRSRFTAERGATALGAFEFGLVGDGCKIAVYARAAISVNNAGVTRVVRGDILTKWLSLRTSLDDDGLGCPLSEERAGPGSSRVQDFQDGRIYARLSTGTVYVPNVFLDVIDKLEVGSSPQTATTVPVTDPVMPVEPITKTWLFQQFVRPDRPDLHPSTLEIRGTPPQLWVERQSRLLETHTAALWDSFPCGGNQGPCTVSPPQTVFPPIQNAGDLFCGGEALEDRKLETLLDCLDSGRGDCEGLEWQHIKADNYIGTPIFGVVEASALAGEDFFASHEWFYNCPLETVRPDCPSDWTLEVVPIGPHRDIGDHPSLFAQGNPTKVEIEYERFYAEFAGWMGFPEPGDLIYAFGRWIIDCGHSSFKSELHPIYMYAKMKTVTEIIDPFTGLPHQDPFGGQPATRADIWVNGWYPGGQPIEFDIYPPPRPTPTAKLVVNKPVDQDAAFGVTIEYSIQPETVANHVHVKFSAPYRENYVDVWGQVMWEINRGYEGQWYLYWQP